MIRIQKKITKIALKHLKMWSSSLIIRQVQIKTIFHLLDKQLSEKLNNILQGNKICHPKMHLFGTEFL